MNKIYLIAISALFVLAGCAPAQPEATGSATCEYPSDGQAARPVTAPATTGVESSGTATATLMLNDQPVALTLDRAKAPCTVNSFLSLAKQGFYDGVACHRLSDSGGLFMLQCGDPSGTGSGGPGYRFADELTGTETYPAGTVAMANTGQPVSNGSQFFLVYADTQLPAAYTVFATMDAAGIAAIEAIAAGGHDSSYGAVGGGRPNSPAVITSVNLG